MEEKRLRIPACLALRTALVALVLAACSMPRVVVLEDPLSAGEHVDLGLAYERQGMLDLAQREYLKASHMKPGWAAPVFNLGNVAFMKKDMKAAEQYYRAALELDGANPDIMNNLAHTLHEQGKDSEAMALIEKALAIRTKAEYLDTKRKITGKQ